MNRNFGRFPNLHHKTSEVWNLVPSVVTTDSVGTEQRSVQNIAHEFIRG
ncbi:MAG: hypothetical protein M9949_15015 [Candidatus Kapabacteria bacterium]|nr:hypothetical protein [Candidatus Kapabacteria bacterium]